MGSDISSGTSVPQGGTVSMLLGRVANVQGCAGPHISHAVSWQCLDTQRTQRDGTW